ncbi:hypothetical protein C0993_010598, partial [Termitomyces sp. T159_Od127]
AHSWDSKPLKTTPTPLSGPDNLLATPSHHRPSPPPATATPGIPLAIIAVTATSAPASAITLPTTATSAPAPATPDTPQSVLRPPSCIITHHRRPDLRTPCLASALLLTALLPCVGLSPGPGTPTLPKRPSQPPWARTAIWPTPLAAPGHHQPSPPVTATSYCHLQHLWPLPAITGHHCHSHRHLWHPPDITAMIATSAPVSAITLPIAATSALAPPVTPGLRRDPHHASQSCITADPTSARHALLLLPPHCSTTVCLCIISARPLCYATCLNLAPPCTAPGSHPKPQHHNPPLEPGPEPQALCIA